jgi:lipoprotein-releasing system permease protein
VPLNEGRGDTVELPGIILGRELARQLGVSIGDPVSVVSPLGTPTAVGLVPRVKRFVMVGQFDSGMSEYDSSLAYVSLEEAQRFFSMEGSVTGLEVRVRDLYDAREVGSDLAQKLGFPYRVRDWMEVNHNLFSALKLEKTVYFIVLLLIILVAAFSIVATLIMVVMEKRKDIAVLMALGATRRDVRLVFVLKGLLVGTAGTFAGLALGAFGCFVLARYQVVSIPREIYGIATVPVAVEPLNFVLVALASILLCLVATFYPARQASREVPAEILRS